MAKINVEFSIDLPVDATREQVREWVEFELGNRGSCSGDNPLIDYEIEADRVSIRRDQF